MWLVELLNPRERHPRFWPRIQSLSFILTSVLLQRKETQRKEDERGWGRTNQCYIS